MQSLTHFRFDIGGDGIAVAIWDMAGRSMNVIDEAVIADLETIVAEACSSDAIRGVVITSGKATFCAGADLAMLETATRRYGERRAEAGDETAMGPGDAATFKAGVADGHHLVNRSGADGVFLVVGSRATRERCHYPDVDLAYASDGAGCGYTRKSGEPY